MATHFKPIDLKEFYGVEYVFDNIGDGIAMHAHVQPELWHDTVCLRGAVEIYGDGVDALIEAGGVAKFKSHRAHEVRALEADTLIINRFLHGKPPGYEGIDPARLSGTVEAELQGRYETDL